MSVSLAGTRFYSDPNYNSHLQQYYREALNRLRAVPGVESAASVDFLPLLAMAPDISMSVRAISSVIRIERTRFAGEPHMSDFR